MDCPWMPWGNGDAVGIALLATSGLGPMVWYGLKRKCGASLCAALGGRPNPQSPYECSLLPLKPNYFAPLAIGGIFRYSAVCGPIKFVDFAVCGMVNNLWHDKQGGVQVKRYVIGITGASGNVYAKRLVEALLQANCLVDMVITKMGEEVWQYELEESFASWAASLAMPAEGNVSTEHQVSPGNTTHAGRPTIHNRDNLFAPIASGSYKVDGMVVVPCSMGSLGKIAHGVGDQLLHRAADVALKEGNPLVLVPRESPLSLIHLENMVQAKRAGAIILPPVPAFYQKPKSVEALVDLTVGRILHTLSVPTDLHKPWGSEGAGGASE